MGLALLLGLTGLVTAQADPLAGVASGVVQAPTADPTPTDAATPGATGPGGSSGAQSTTSVAAAAEPLVIVVDLSSSMTEDDGSGTIKLDGAKTALIDVVRRQVAGAAVGLWTYPSPSQDCSPGGYVAGSELRAVVDPSTLAADIRALEAQGNTPTGDALRAVTDDLVAGNHSSATLLLVSDGESNCGVPPCEVAQQIVDDGFDITVQAMGFQISDAGRDELECIAAATSGQYYDVEDSTQLGTLLDEISVPAVTLDVTAVESVPSGSATTVTAVVRNPSAQPVDDLSVSLSFADEGSRTLFPAVVPPRYRLGNLPAGASVTRSWTLSTAGGQTGQASWRVSAWTPDVGATSATGTIEVTGSTLGLSSAGPLLTQALAAGPVVVLGDSFSSGEGAGDYLPASTDAEHGCHRSNHTYGTVLFGVSSATIIACSGAVTGDLLTPNDDRKVEAQLRQIDALDQAPGLVVMTMGGNDIGFANIVTKCVKPGDCSQDTDFTTATYRDVASLQTSLEASYRAVDGVVNSAGALRSRSGVVAPVVVLAYPQVLPYWQRASCSGFTASEVKFANDVVNRLDSVIAASVATLAAEGRPVYVVGQVQDAVLPDHTACSKEPFINPVDLGSGIAGKFTGKDVELVHPNASGYQAIANALVGWSQTDDAAPRTVAVPVGVPPMTAGVSSPVATIDLSTPGSASVRVESGSAVEVLVEGLAPGTTVTITVRSAPRAVASWVADEAGTARGVAYIPPDLAAGSHTLVASGLDADLAVLVREQPLTVLQHRPWWFWPATGLSAALLLGAAGGWVVRRRTMRPTSKEDQHPG